MSFIMKKCPVCGKSFYPAPYHVFVVNGRDYYCSWTCFNSAPGVSDKRRKVRCKKVEQYTLDGELIRIFRNADEAAEYIDTDPKLLKTACNKDKPFKGYLWKRTN